MKYFKIPINNDILDVAKTDEFDLLFYVGDGKTVYGILEEGVVRDSWEEITEDEFEHLTVEQQETSLSFEESVINRLNKMQEQLNAMEQTQAYLFGLQTGAYDDAMEPIEEDTTSE